MNSLQIFLPCAAGVEGFLADEVHDLTGLTGHDLLTGRGGVLVRASWRQALQLNLHSRLAQRVLVQLAERMYRSENDLYAIVFAGLAILLIALGNAGYWRLQWIGAGMTLYGLLYFIAHDGLVHQLSLIHI